MFTLPSDLAACCDATLEVMWLRNTPIEASILSAALAFAARSRARFVFERFDDAYRFITEEVVRLHRADEHVKEGNSISFRMVMVVRKQDLIS